jgi:CubicO group peptidase (beta-lactamase class C family)
MSSGAANPSNGTVGAGFEPGRDAFESGDLGAGGGAFCAYLDGEKVVDLWGGAARPGVPWAEETMSTLFSATKGLTTLCAQVLSDRRQLDIEAPVARYWPEFAQAPDRRPARRRGAGRRSAPASSPPT